MEKANSCGSISEDVQPVDGQQIRLGLVATTFARVYEEETEFARAALSITDICATVPLKAMMKVVASTKVRMTAFLFQMAKDDISEIIASDQLNKMTKTHLMLVSDEIFLRHASKVMIMTLLTC